MNVGARISVLDGRRAEALVDSIEKAPEFPEIVSEVVGIDEAAWLLGMSPTALYFQLRSQIDDESDWIANEIYEDPRGRAA